jgi:hypothetical protein
MDENPTDGSRYHEIIISEHARIRMRERRISEQQVARTINQPDVVKVGAKNRLIAERATSQGNTIRVVYIETQDGPLLVSAVVVTAVRIAPRRIRT